MAHTVLWRPNPFLTSILKETAIVIAKAYNCKLWCRNAAVGLFIYCGRDNQIVIYADRLVDEVSSP